MRFLSRALWTPVLLLPFAASITGQDGRTAPSRMEKKIREKLRAPRAKIKVLKEGGARVEITYDFSTREQLEAFSSRSIEFHKGAVKLRGTQPSPAHLTLRPVLRGDFTIHVRFTLEEDPATGSGAIWLRTAEGTTLAGADDGAGCGIVRRAQWDLSIGRFGSRPKILSEWKKVEVSADAEHTLSLERKGSRFTGSFGKNVSVSSDQDGWPRVHIQFGSGRKVRVTEFKIKGTLDAGWIEEILGIDPPLFSRDLRGWIHTGGRPPHPGDRGVAFDAPENQDFILVHKAKQKARRAKYTLVVDIEKEYEWPVINFGLVLAGSRLSREGNLLVRYGWVYTKTCGLRVDRLQNGRWVMLSGKRTWGKNLRRGKNTLEMIREGRDLVVRANGAAEHRFTGVLPANAEFRLALVLQNLRGRIVSVRKE